MWARKRKSAPRKLILHRGVLRFISVVLVAFLIEHVWCRAIVRWCEIDICRVLCHFDQPGNKGNVLICVDSALIPCYLALTWRKFATQYTEDVTVCAGGAEVIYHRSNCFLIRLKKLIMTNDGPIRAVRKREAISIRALLADCSTH